ncbi:MAG: hypothetical protein LBE83_10755, partial [Propionibacteriaceae bacterium]|nr:hypothetical protein [Propionibacteriaceae bacterium]
YPFDAPWFVDQGNIALTLADNATITRCITMVIGLTSGTILTNLEDPTPRGWPDPNQPNHPSHRNFNQVVMAYQEGIVVVSDSTSLDGSGSICAEISTTTTAYRATDLTSPLWRLTGIPQGHWCYSAPQLPGLVLAVVPNRDYAYVSITTGKPMITLDPGVDATYFEAGGAILQSLDLSGRATGGVITRWPDQPATSPSWSLTLPSRTGLSGLGCTTRDSFIFVTYDFQSGTESIWAVNLDTGQKSWSIAYPDLYYGPQSPINLWTCGILTIGDQALVAVPSGSGIALIDAASGGVVATLADLATGTDSGVSGVYPCGYDLACAIVATHPTRLDVTVFDYSTSPLTIIDELSFVGVPGDLTGPTTMLNVSSGPTARPAFAFPTADGLIVPYWGDTFGIWIL